jgi:hypothetical protein
MAASALFACTLPSPPPLPPTHPSTGEARIYAPHARIHFSHPPTLSSLADRLHRGPHPLASQRKRKAVAGGKPAKGSAKKTGKAKKANTQTPSKSAVDDVHASDPVLYRAMLKDADGGDAAIDKWVSRYENEENQYVATPPAHLSHTHTHTHTTSHPHNHISTTSNLPSTHNSPGVLLCCSHTRCSHMHAVALVTLKGTTRPPSC